MKKTVAFTIIIIFIIGVTVYSKVKQAKKTIHYTALGDSIAEGLSAADNHGYTYLLYKYFASSYKTVDYNNLAKSGDASDDMLYKLKNDETVKNAVKTADVITVCIGGNDLLRGSQSFMQGDLSDLDNRINNFSSNWDEINKTIKNLNPNAKVYVMNLYNPINIGDYYLGMRCDEEKWKIIDSYIKRLNAVITSNDFMKKYDYEVADIYSAFKQNLSQGKLTNFKSSADPHPTDAGHELICKQHILLLPKER